MKKIQIIIQATKESFYEGMSGWLSLQTPRLIHKRNINGIEVPFTINDAAILKFFSMPSTVPFASVCFTDKNESVIVVNEAFSELPVIVQNALLLHELGHIGRKVKPVKFYNIRRLLGDKYILNEEYYADFYSQHNGGDMIGALRYLKSLGIFNNREINKRVARLNCQFNTYNQEV